MASEKLFRDIPPFPENVPTMPMHTVSLAGLNSRDEKTAQQALDACQELGFFLVDLRGDELGEAVMEEIDHLFAVGKDIMDLPQDVKRAFLHDIPRSFLGFKPRGHAKTETEEPDRFEWFNIGQDGLMGTTPLQPLPALVHTHLALFTSFLKHAQRIVATVSATLARQLSLPEDTFSSLQTPTKPSGTVVRLIKAFASPAAQDLRTSMIHHTDFGTVTLLANVLGGLQILTPGGCAADEDAWRWVRPQPGCLIVNLGDAMVQWTGGLLRSNVHRIRYPPGEQRFVDRYSLALLVRPERDASMRSKVGAEADDAEDANLTAWEWEVKKAMSLSRGEAVMKSTGGKPVVV
ncbi:2OG-Fe(II) oxygenase superfamily protein [Hirsutella rhossiliensis]|uniref:2OG-Fe(II) oxygenase superfamily domain-containing protein n=1 Tax=Hirsutella rhossiliensis TaxID=111463 RepID=A0A9P8SIS8_9HYPO|nr:2OG-Fe(II) oxygenase superfamily domain-containing protein [Hirsutella rhossiliensis]KAH0964201.1 2OG-Fe(II) oxygenase superfamily domain-containing protein [Hirsutella rhossiliensis]